MSQEVEGGLVKVKGCQGSGLGRFGEGRPGVRPRVWSLMAAG